MGTATEVIPQALDPALRVFRAYPFPDSLNRSTGKPQPKLFYLKAGESGLSVGLSVESTLLRYPGAAGMCSLVVGTVKDSPDPLDVVPDATDHAEIRGVPLRSEDQEKAIRIAKYLARIAEHRPDAS
jgi:hypothetical protein